MEQNWQPTKWDHSGEFKSQRRRGVAKVSNASKSAIATLLLAAAGRATLSR